MKRLLDSEDGGPLFERARQLLRAAQPDNASLTPAIHFGQPIEPGPRSAARTHERFVRWFQRTQTHASRRLKPALVVGFVTVAAGAAARLGAQAWHGSSTLRGSDASELPITAKPPVERAKAVRTQTARPTEARASETSNEVREPEPRPELQPARAQVGAAPLRSPARSEAPEQRTRSHETARTAETTAAPPTGSHAELVHSAMRALRRDGDPERAARLLDSYRGQDANGPLAEEALALRIEAALARGSDSARSCAQDYLERYPRGRYRAVALRAVRNTGRP